MLAFGAKGDWRRALGALIDRAMLNRLVAWPFALGVLACSDSPEVPVVDAQAAAETPEDADAVPADASADVATDGAKPDVVSKDAKPDVTLDAPADVVKDVSNDVASDVTIDAPKDVAADSTPPPTGWVDITAGRGHTCVLQASGAVACWGDNFSGQLGKAATGTEANPYTIASITNVAAIAAGLDHTCALQTDGTALCWGAPSCMRDARGRQCVVRGHRRFPRQWRPRGVEFRDRRGGPCRCRSAHRRHQPQLRPSQKWNDCLLGVHIARSTGRDLRAKRCHDRQSN